MTTMSRSRRSGNPSVVTYRLNGKMVYVTPAEDYEQALDFAQNVFPELANTSREHISFSITVKGDERKPRNVRIGPMAWGPVVTTLPQYHFIEIHVTIPGSELDAPPQYPASESKEYYRSHSTPSSPSLRPDSSLDSREKRRSWVGKFLG